MKIRMGFVSNSSSCSFSIYGVCFDDEDLKKHFNIDGLTGYEIRGKLFKVLEGLDLEVEYPYDSSVYIGRDVTHCADNQTMGDFKKAVREEVNSMTSEKIKDGVFGFFSESWMDG